MWLKKCNIYILEIWDREERMKRTEETFVIIMAENFPN